MIKRALKSLFYNVAFLLPLVVSIAAFYLLILVAQGWRP